MSEARKVKKVMYPSALAPMVVAGSLDLPNVDAIILRNAGTATVNLWGGTYSLAQCETLSLNMTELDAMLQIQNVPVTFDTSTGAVQKLQILMIKSVDC